MLVKKFKRCRVLVIGDVILDHYTWGTVSRISPEAPVPIVNVTSETEMLGGAANVAHNLSRLGIHTEVIGLIGEDDDAKSFKRLLRAAAIPTRGLVQSPALQTSRKTRVIAHNQQVVRVDRESTKKTPPAVKEKLVRKFNRLLPDYQAVILEDYGKGVLDQALVNHIIKQCRVMGIYVAIDPKVEHHLHFKGASLATPNTYEAEYLAKWIQKELLTIPGQGDQLRRALGLKHLLITLGEQGMALFMENQTPAFLPTRSKEVFDVSGAGDTVISVFTASIAAGAKPVEAAHMANLAGGLVVGKLGTATLSPNELLDNA